MHALLQCKLRASTIYVHCQLFPRIPDFMGILERILHPPFWGYRWQTARLTHLQARLDANYQLASSTTVPGATRSYSGGPQTNCRCPVPQADTSYRHLAENNQIWATLMLITGVCCCAELLPPEFCAFQLVGCSASRQRPIPTRMNAASSKN